MAALKHFPDKISPHTPTVETNGKPASNKTTKKPANITLAGK